MQFDTVKNFNENKSGRDFVVGDIHGMISLLDKKLHDISFDPECDRLFSVGDLIDRGEDSEAVLDLLDEPWFHAVRGNHEDLLLQSESGNIVEHQIWMQNGGGWWTAVSDHDKTRYIDAVRSLPIVIEVETAKGSVGIVHADIIPNIRWSEFVEKIACNDERAIKVAIWSRTTATWIERGMTTEGPDDIWRVFCGHTIFEDTSIKRSDNIYFIDTGAFLSCERNDNEGPSLTLIPITENNPLSYNVRTKRDLGVDLTGT